MCYSWDCVAGLGFPSSDTKEQIMITRLEVIPKDGGISYSVEDGWGNSLGDAPTIGEACQIAKEIAITHEMTEFIVLVEGR